MQTPRFIPLGIVTLCLSLAAGCAASGPAFKPPEMIASDKALVYVYRPNSIIGGAIRYHVMVGEEPIVYMIRGGYFPYQASPGEIEFWAQTEAKASASADLAAGNTYYLQCGIAPGIGIGRPTMKLVGAQEAMQELPDTVLLPPADKTE